MSRLVFIKWITRDLVRNSPEARFVFGDNVQRIGHGGQAGAMRGEPNAIGVATKRAPGMNAEDFFSDADGEARAVVDSDLAVVEAALADSLQVVVPVDGLGTGLSELPQRAPHLHAHIVDRFRGLHSRYGAGEFPWDSP